MKVLFVASGNKSVGTISPFVRSQYESLQQEGLDMLLYPIVGHGWKPYAKAIVDIHKLIKKEKPDIVHAHYSVCGVVASLASCCTKTKVVVSILGSFPSQNFKVRWVRFFIKYIWDSTLVKSQRTANQLGLDLPIVPNGVNLEQFQLIDYHAAKVMCGFEDDKKYVIWCSHPSRKEKRYELAEAAVCKLQDNNVVLYPVFDKEHDEVVKYMCAADVLLLTSVSEGSPNVIKEAMACNCPIVSTDVGDVSVVTKGVEKSIVSKNDTAEELAKSIQTLLTSKERTNGRNHLIEAGLTTQNIAKKIIRLYYGLKDA